MQADPLTPVRPAEPGLSSEFHRWPLPGYLWPALERRSRSIYCTEPHLRIHGALTPSVEAWVARHNGSITGLWLFRRRGRVARVVNEVATEPVKGVARFADALFARYPEIDVIELHALHLAGIEHAGEAGTSPSLAAAPGFDDAARGLDEAEEHEDASDGSHDDDHHGHQSLLTDARSGPPAPLRSGSRRHWWQRHCWQRAVVSEDFVLELPASVDEWLAALTPRNREKVRQCLRRAQRSEPPLRFVLRREQEISLSQVRAVLALSRERMRAKGRRYGMDAQQERQLYALMRERGLLMAIEIDGQLRAGLLCTLAGEELYMHVVAHDPGHDALRLGYLCCILGIEAAIAQGLKRFHFLWGWYDYKQRLGAQRRVLHHALLWRSPLAACRHPLQLIRQWLLGLRSALRERRMARQLARRSHVH